jgi:adenosylhomocysteine nucleosidase
MSRHILAAIPEELDFKKEIHGIPVTYSGVGKINAALAAMELAQQGVREIINIGSCASSKHGTGEILRIGRVYQDIDASPICDYGLIPFEKPEPFILLNETSDLSCFSTDYFFDQAQIGKYSSHYLERIRSCDAVDMELYGIASACKRKNIKLSAYKWVSDDGDLQQWLDNCMHALYKLIDSGELVN